MCRDVLHVVVGCCLWLLLFVVDCVLVVCVCLRLLVVLFL